MVYELYWLVNCAYCLEIEVMIRNVPLPGLGIKPGKQGSDLIELRLTWREMKYWIFGDLLGFFLKIFDEF